MEEMQAVNEYIRQQKIVLADDYVKKTTESNRVILDLKE